MLEDLLSKLGASTKITVGVSISPSVGLEMVEIDRLTGTINKYANKPLEYNHSTREITDYNQFQDSLEELFEDLHIPKRSNVVLSIPNVHFGMIKLPLLLTDEAITNAIMSEVEQSYIFKRQEPVIVWSEVFSNIDTENRTLAYTAVQKSVLDGIEQVFKDVGCTMVGLENSYSSLLRALYFTESTKEQMKDGVTWNLMLIGQNSYSIISMLDKKVTDYYEEPLALKSFVDDEIYNAIMTSAQLTLAGLPANYLVIVSETDLVSAEVLSMKMELDCPVKFIECNKYTQSEMTTVNLNILPKSALQITAEVIGAAIYPFCDFPLKLNLINTSEDSSDSTGEADEFPKMNIGNLEIELTPSFVKRLSLLIGGILILPMFLLSLFLGSFLIPKEKAKQDDIKSKMDQINAEIAQYTNASKDNTFDVKSTTTKIITQNKAKLDYYSALGMSIPNQLWVTYYVTNEANKVDIKGKSSDVGGIYNFYKNLKQLVNNSDIRLYKLEIASESIDDVVANMSNAKYYNFEITNMTDDELNPKAADAKKADGTQTNAQNGQQSPSPQGPSGPPSPGGPNAGPSAPPGMPSQPGNPAAKGGNLPPNLQKIEKF